MNASYKHSNYGNDLQEQTYHNTHIHLHIPNFRGSTETKAQPSVITTPVVPSPRGRGDGSTHPLPAEQH